MKKYQVLTFFEWGPFKLEPLQYLSVQESKQPNTYIVTLDKTNQSIQVNKKAFQNQLKLGNINKA